MSYTSRMPDNPLRRMQAITKSDATEYDPPIILLRCGGAGDLSVKDIEGNTVAITGIVAGEYVPGPFKQILNASTTTAMVGWKNE
jgi:hypothetical protein